MFRVHLCLSLQVHILLADALAKILFVQLFLERKQQRQTNPNTRLFVAIATTVTLSTFLVLTTS